MTCHHSDLKEQLNHYSDIMMSAMASQITGISIVCSTFCLGTDQRKHQTPCHRPLWMEPLMTNGFPSQKASNMGNVSISWYHHVWNLNKKSKHFPRKEFDSFISKFSANLFRPQWVNASLINGLLQCGTSLQHSQTQIKLTNQYVIAQLYRHCEILHRAWQYHCHALCQISIWLLTWNGCYW